MGTLLLDTYSLFYRAFHALPPMNTASGEPTNALYGLSVLLLKLLREEAPEGLAFALDGPQATFRHEAFAEYKAGRAQTPTELSRQFTRLEQLIAALGVPAHRVAGFEADDVLATLARELVSQGRPVLVVSGDRDLLQLARPDVAVLFVGARGKPPTRYDEAAVQARFGVPSSRLPTYVALVGDPSDNLPKVPGIGQSTAQKLVAEHEDASSLLAHVDSVRSEKLRLTLKQYDAQIRASETLARLRDDVPLTVEPRTSVLSEESFARTRALFEELEFRSLLARLDKLRPKVAG